MIEIGDKIFKTKKEATDFIRGILYGNLLNMPLSDDGLVFVCDLLEKHPDKNEKIGVGVKSIITEEDANFHTTRHFSIIRNDNTKIDFSFNKCLTPNLNDPLKLFHSSARRAIADQILVVKDILFQKNMDADGNILCALTGEMIDKKSCHVDHIPPKTFDKIVSDFIDENKIDVSMLKYKEACDGIGREFEDDKIKQLFSDYHEKVAKLRIVSVKANLSQKKK
jgi:hypothetical protein